MQIPENTPSFDQLTVNQRFFVSLWYSLSHEASLDSNRVRLHNGRTILKELGHELNLEIMRAEQLQGLIQEAKTLSENDPALSEVLGNSFNLLASFLNAAGEFLEVDAKKDKNESKKKNGSSIYSAEAIRRLLYLTQDVSEALPRPYLDNLKGKLLNNVLSESEKIDEIESVTKHFMSDLVERGYTLESLHPWAVTLLKVKTDRPFSQRIEFMLNSLTQDPQRFDVHLRITGKKELCDIGSLGGFKFTNEVPEVSSKYREITKYLKPSEQTIFASSEVTALDFTSASYEALEAFERSLDRIRFNFSRTRIRPDHRILVVRKGDLKPRLEEISFSVPNPVFVLKSRSFARFNERLDSLLNSRRVESISAKRLLAAARHYRLGQDSDSYRDKLLNWWMGLEYLTKSDTNCPIGDHVKNVISNLMMERYVFWLLQDLIYSLRGNCPGLKVISAKYDPDLNDASLSPKRLLPLLQQVDFRTEIEPLIEHQPLLKKRFIEISADLSDPKKTHALLKGHNQRIRWQILRIYGIRCCLVHGTPVCLKFLLPTANLEFYLRESLVVVLKTLARFSHIGSLSEIYERFDFAWQGKLAQLSDTDADALTIQHSVFDNGVTEIPS